MYRPFAVIAGLCLLAVPALGDDMPKMGRAEGMQLFAAAGFPLKGKEVFNTCGAKAMPSVVFSDVNGDGFPEAVFVDAGPCYPTGHWVSVLHRGPSGQWVRILGAGGTAQPVNHKTGAWFDIAVTSQGKATVMHFDGTRYVAAAQPAPPAPGSPPGAATRLPGVVQVRVEGTPTALETAALARALPDDEKAALDSKERALVFRVTHADLNSDGLPDLIAQIINNGWCGSLGCSGVALLATPTGYGTKPIGLATFYQTVAVLPEARKGMHDLRYDDATYVFHWNGRNYD